MEDYASLFFAIAIAVLAFFVGAVMVMSSDSTVVVNGTEEKGLYTEYKDTVYKLTEVK